MAKYEALKSMILEKFHSESKMASELGWPRQRLNKITNGVKEPDLEEVEAIAEKLGSTFSDVAHIFLQK